MKLTPVIDTVVMALADGCSFRVTRRSFLKGMTLVPAGLYVMPIAAKMPSPPPQPAARHAAVLQVLEDAMASRSMTSALQKHDRSLTPDEKRILAGITPEELALLQSARRKLKLRNP